METRRVDVKKLTVCAFFCALAYVLAAFLDIKVFAFLSLEFKDAILMIGSFIYGPLSGCLMAIAVSLLEIPSSSTGWIGAVMNIVSSCAFILPAAWMYRRKRTMGGAVLGLIVATVCMVVTMVLWNILLTPLFMENTTREAVMGMIPTIFLPFNILKGAMNSAIILLLYKYVVNGLRQARLLPAEATVTSHIHRGRTWILAAVSIVILEVGVVAILFINEVL